MYVKTFANLQKCSVLRENLLPSRIYTPICGEKSSQIIAMPQIRERYGEVYTHNLSVLCALLYTSVYFAII